MKLSTIFISVSTLIVCTFGTGLSSVALAGSTIPSRDNIPPAAPLLRIIDRNICASAPCPQDVTFAWTESTRAASYQLYKNGLPIKTFSASDDLRYIAHFDGMGVTYAYKVKATNPYGSAVSNTVNYTTTDNILPSAPTNLTVSSGNTSGCGTRLTWNASTDNIGIDHYGVTRVNNSSHVVSNFTVAGNQTFYDDVFCFGPVNFSYTVRAFDAAGNVSSPSNEVVYGVDITPPSAPVNLAINNGDICGVRLTWMASTDNVGVSQYEITRVNNYDHVVTRFIVPGTQTTYDDVFCYGPVSFSYTVRAIDAAGNFSSPSNQVFVPFETD